MKQNFRFTEKVEEMSNKELKKQQGKVKKINLPEIRAVDFLYEKGGEITYEYPELTAVCPMTGIQDSYTVKDYLHPGQKDS